MVLLEQYYLLIAIISNIIKILLVLRDVRSSHKALNSFLLLSYADMYNIQYAYINGTILPIQ